MLNIKVITGDIIESAGETTDGLINYSVIPTDNLFSEVVDGILISPNTLHGQSVLKLEDNKTLNENQTHVEYLESRKEDLKKHYASIPIYSTGISGLSVEIPEFLYKANKYIADRLIQFVCIPIGHFDENLKFNASLEKLTHSINVLAREIFNDAMTVKNRNRYLIPSIGTGVSGLFKTDEESFEFIGKVLSSALRDILDAYTTLDNYVIDDIGITEAYTQIISFIKFG